MADFIRVPSPAARTTTAAGRMTLTGLPFGFEMGGGDIRRIAGGFRRGTRAGPDLGGSGPELRSLVL
ncbi:hypothetical protein GCM10010389_43080 [Streptomyces echinoruber]|uniref:Uncharacterized protein n=1 Tax=Streptomyces echinoruber TaxID=68898 RepID=A0A918VGD0_9ACTN|nr:hypothetical protein GCM10010389_43080 [Streptomyces echinoruber]